METLAALNLADVISPIVSILYVAIGLGLVIFFHELGHFAVAKWCGVHVERFSIGFGPIIWSRQKGETEYAVSAIPFGGYVKMLGQDDLDPNQMADGAIAQNPRSYSAKSVPQRMAIIAAGVTMNVITGLLFFAVAFRLGVLTPPATVGAVVPGSSAWKAGLKRGDDITHVDGSQVKSFMDLTLSVALSSYDIVVEGVRTDETPFKTRVTPDASGNRRTIGVVPVMGLELNVPPDAEYGPTSPGLPGSQADPSFKAGDLIRSVGGEAVSEFAELAELLAKRRDEDLEFIVDRTDENGQVSSVSTTVSARRFHSLGLWMDIGGIVAIRENSPLQPGSRSMTRSRVWAAWTWEPRST